MRATATTDLLELQDWCRAYDKWTPYPSNTLERFLIAMYQIPGAVDWGDSQLNKWESLASCAIHVVIAAERMKAGLEATLLPRNLKLIPTRVFNPSLLLNCLCKSAQQLTYGNPRNKTQRARSRFNLAVLSVELGNLVIVCLSGIPSDHRSMAIQDATLIMTGKL